MTPRRLAEILYPEDHVYKVAIYPELVDLEAYSPEGEWVGFGYEAGGMVLSGRRIEIEGDEAVLRFDRAEWLNADIKAQTLVVYDATTLDVINLTKLERVSGVYGGLFEFKIPDEGVVRVR